MPSARCTRASREAGDPLEHHPRPSASRLKAERILDGLGGGNRPSATAIVALRPSTGDVLAAASGPGTEGLNIATFGQYAPGSTFKVVSALALLRAGVHHRAARCRARRRSWWTARPSRTTTTTRLPRSAGSLCARPSPTPATPRSSASATSSARRRPGRRRCRARGRRGPRPRLPGVLRPGPTARR